jgi:hypothetical protein
MLARALSFKWVRLEAEAAGGGIVLFFGKETR